MKIKLLDYFSGKVCISDELRSRVVYEIPFWDDKKSPIIIKGDTLKRSEQNYYELMGCRFHFVPKGTICNLKLQITDLFGEEIASSIDHQLLTKHDCFIAVQGNEIKSIVPLLEGKEAEAFQEELGTNDRYGRINIMRQISSWLQ